MLSILKQTERARLTNQTIKPLRAATSFGKAAQGACSVKQVHDSLTMVLRILQKMSNFENKGVSFKNYNVARMLPKKLRMKSKIQRKCEVNNWKLCQKRNASVICRRVIDRWTRFDLTAVPRVSAWRRISVCTSREHGALPNAPP